MADYLEGAGRNIHTKKLLDLLRSDRTVQLREPAGVMEGYGGAKTPYSPTFSPGENPEITLGDIGETAFDVLAPLGAYHGEAIAGKGKAAKGGFPAVTKTIAKLRGEQPHIGAKRPAGEGFAYSVMKDRKKAGTIAGFEKDDLFHMYKTGLSDESAKGTGLYQKAVQDVADQYPGGLFVHEWESSAALKKALAKMPTYRMEGDRIVIGPSPPKPSVNESAAFKVTPATPPEILRGLESDPVRSLFGTKHKGEEAIAKKVANLSYDTPAPLKRTREELARVDPDKYRQMYQAGGIEPVLEAARAGEHLRPDPSGGFIGAPRHVRSMQAVNQLRKNLDKQLAGGAEAIAAAETAAGTPERIGTWYPRAKAFNEQINEPHQLDRWLEGVGTYSAGVSPESELAFNLKHWNSRALGYPKMAYRGAPMRSLDEAVAQDRPAELGFKIGEYAKKNDPRLVDESPFGVNDFRMAQAHGYTDVRGEPWTAGVKDTMHPFMDAETALLVERANQRALGGRTDWTGEASQEIPWVAGKAQDLYERGKTARFAGGREGMIKALREANRTAADYAPKHELGATHEATPGASTGHRADVLAMPYEARRAYGEEGSWIRPDDQKDVLYSALGLRQQPAVQAAGVYPNQAGVLEQNPLTMSRPLVDFQTAGERGVPTGSIAPVTMRAVENTERMRALVDAQEAGAANLPVTGNRPGKTSRLLDTGGRQLAPDEMARVVEILRGAGSDIMPTATPRGVQLLNFGDAKAARDLPMDELRAAVPDAEVLPSAHEGAYVKGLGPVQGSGGYTARMLRHMTELPQHAVANLSESPGVRSAISAKMLRDAPSDLTRADLQKTREFLSEADWAKAVQMIRQGMKPAAAVAALGYSLSGMAAEGEPNGR